VKKDHVDQLTNCRRITPLLLKIEHKKRRLSVFLN